MTASPPRTLWVTNDFPPRSGGIEQFVDNLLRRMDPAAVRVITSRYPGAEAHDRALPYPVARIARRPLLPTRAVARQIKQEAARHAAELVVFGASWPLAELAPFLPLPSVALTHGHEAGIAKVGGGLLIRHALRGVNGIGVISDYTQRSLTPWVPPATAVHRIPPGVDVDRFHPGISGADIRACYGVGDDTPLVVCLSRLVARKGQDVLIEAWPSVVRAVAGASLLIAGSGPMEQALRRRVNELRLEGDVSFAGDVGAADLPRFHAAADLFVMPCRTRALGLDVEGLGIVYLEAQATGTPVIAGTSGGAPEAVVDGETGMVVDGRDVAAVAECVIELHDDPARRAAMGAAGRRFVTQQYSWDVVSQRFTGMLTEAASG
jgi:phosphatidylinositol alpha-1,6-mannosyltransferase